MPLITFPLAFPAISTVTEGITATPGGTQAAGVQLVSRYNRVSVCATGGDSVVLPPYLVDLSIYVSNDGAAALNVFPYTGQAVNAAAVNTAFSVAAGKTAVFVGSGTGGKWAALVSA